MPICHVFILLNDTIYKKGTKISHSLLITATYSTVRCIFSTPDNFKLHRHLLRTREVLMFSSTGQKFASPDTHICAERYIYLSHPCKRPCHTTTKMSSSVMSSNVNLWHNSRLIFFFCIRAVKEIAFL
jgi:hypothetical protein